MKQSKREPGKYRISPTEHIANTPNPKFESSHIKVMGYNPAEISVNRGICYNSADARKIAEYLGLTDKKNYTSIHTHTGNWSTQDTTAQTEPSQGDLLSFFNEKKAEFLRIDQQNYKDGTISGFLLFKKKNKPTKYQLKQREILLEAQSNPDTDTAVREKLHKSVNLVKDKPSKYFADEYGLSYKFFPISPDNPINMKLREQYKKRGGGVFNYLKNLIHLKKEGLEGKVAVFVTSIFSFILALFFLSSNLTGDVISSLNQTSSNVIGLCLLLLGLVGAFMYFRKKK
ncbi:MAG: hypothetical protein PHH54_05930 [Candidatus Nanoarchaeia archaeon]|nr:hypothetical protein [Candidatus Nanoarchaeia archaeon]MDD5741493.1 hypothetical protein [Candidatus Nanoarchaeia archaeon]